MPFGSGNFLVRFAKSGAGQERPLAGHEINATYAPTDTRYPSLPSQTTLYANPVPESYWV